MRKGGETGREGEREERHDRGEEGEREEAGEGAKVEEKGGGSEDQPPPPPPVTVDPSLPTTSVQIRLADGSRYIITFPAGYNGSYILLWQRYNLCVVNP